MKRASTSSSARLLIVVGLPLWLLIALAIKLDSRGPVFFVDRRIGVGEREFGMLKFRTMGADAAEQQERLEDDERGLGGAVQDPGRPARDARRSGAAAALDRRAAADRQRRSAGEMSLVGPRPLPLRDYELLEDWHRARYLVLPGMTGLWQISGRSGLVVRRSRPARLHLPRELVDLARHHDHREDDPRRDRRPRRVLSI